MTTHEMNKNMIDGNRWRCPGCSSTIVPYKPGPGVSEAAAADHIKNCSAYKNMLRRGL